MRNTDRLSTSERRKRLRGARARARGRDRRRPAIRDATTSLLTGWGYDVIAVGSGDEAILRLSACPARPELILCDYRLRDGESGLAVTDRIRSEYNETIPAILITGDTAPDRLAEAKTSGLLLMHKPVSNGKLRAAIVNLTAASGARSMRVSRPSNETDLPGERRSLGAIDHIHRLEDRGDVGLHRLFRETQFEGDRQVRPSVGDQPQDLDLAIGQRRGSASGLNSGGRRRRQDFAEDQRGT